MKRYIENIKVNEVFHLKGFSIPAIPIVDDKTPHLIITGRNGSGKTALLTEIMKSLRGTTELLLRYSSQEGLNLHGRVEIEFAESNPIGNEGFIIAYYGTDRKIEMSEPKTPTKPNFRGQEEFLNFLSDLKIKQVFAKNEQLTEEVDKIERWFTNFESLLKEVFQDEDLRLDFNYKDYSFNIKTKGRSFKFTEMSSGFSAIFDIVIDLLMKMQNKNDLAWNCEQEGIVLIDEVEAHLHLDLQKAILPFLTKTFPNIQFIVTTHSPFVLNSINTAVAFDLDKRELLKGLIDYSYGALVDGYFSIDDESSYVQMKLDRLGKLLNKKYLSVSDLIEMTELSSDFDKMDIFHSRLESRDIHAKDSD